MIYQKTIANTAELLQGLSELGNLVANEVVWFRGHASTTFTLLPSIARNPNGIARESLLGKRFKQNAHPFRHSPPTTEWEWLFLMQHFGVPTRLLDWTESPLTALYFTVFDDNPARDAEAGHMWALLPTRFNHDVPRIRPQVPIDIPCFGVDGILDSWRPDVMALDPMTNQLPVAALAHRQNERIMAQMGVFTIMHRDATPLEQLADQHLARFTVPAVAKPTIKTELANLRVTKLMLFPELANVALLAKEVLL